MPTRPGSSAEGKSSGTPAAEALASGQFNWAAGFPAAAADAESDPSPVVANGSDSNGLPQSQQVRDSSEGMTAEEESSDDEVPEYAEVGRALDGIQAALDELDRRSEALQARVLEQQRNLPPAPPDHV